MVSDIESRAARSGPSFLELEIPLQANAIRRTAERCRAEIDRDEIRHWKACEHLVFAGCGDSLFAAELAATAAASEGRRNVVALEALELSRYLVTTLDEKSVVVVLSYSGETVRAQEAAVAARSRGARVIAVTRDAAGTLALLADSVISYPDLGERSNTRTASFQAAIVVLLELLDTLPMGTAVVKPPRPWAAIADEVEAMSLGWEGQLRSVRDLWDLDRLDEILYIGAGPGLVAARYGAAKAYEAATIRARVAELEEFCHCEIFSITPGTPVVVILPAGRSLDRGSEVLSALTELGAATVSLSTPGERKKGSLMCATQSGTLPELYSPMTSAPFLQSLALHCAIRRNEDPDIVRNKPVNSPLIRSCQSWSPADYQALDERKSTR